MPSSLPKRTLQKTQLDLSIITNCLKGRLSLQKEVCRSLDKCEQLHIGVDKVMEIFQLPSLGTLIKYPMPKEKRTIDLRNIKENKDMIIKGIM